jgi:hypothetical protein
LSRPLFAQILNVPVVTVRKWESGERTPSGAALRLLQVMNGRPEALLQMAGLIKTANRIQRPQVKFQSHKKTMDVIRKGRPDHLRQTPSGRLVEN